VIPGYDEALPLFRQVGDVIGEANCIKSLGDVALRRSDHEGARARYEKVLSLYRRIEQPTWAGCWRRRGRASAETTWSGNWVRSSGGTR
jgi:hypothetical protein